MTITFKDSGLILRRRKWSIAIALLASLGLGVALNATTEPVYRATARIEIQRESNRSLLTGEMTQNMTFQAENVALTTAAEMITNRRLLERVVQNLRDRETTMGEVGRGRDLEAQVDWLAARLTVEPIRDTRLVNIHVEHTSRRRAEEIANLVASTFAEVHSQERAAGVGSMLSYLEDQLSQVKVKIESAERSLVDGQTVDSYTLEKRLEQLTLTSGDLQRKLTVSNAELAQARQIYKSLHPKLVSLETENATIREEIAASEREMHRINDTLQRYSLTQGELKSNRELYGMLMLKLKEAQINGQMETSLVQLVQAAASQADPVRPRKTLNIVVCLVAGLLAGVGFAFLREVMRHTIRTPDQVTEYLQLPVLGMVPKVARP